MNNNHLTPGVEPEDKGNQISLQYILQPDWTLLLLVNIQGSLHCKQGLLLANTQDSLHCKQGLLLVNIQGSLHCKQGLLLVNIKGSLHCKQSM